MTQPMNQKKCLLVHPEFNSQSFWNYRKTCEMVGAKYPAAPLGLITVAALFPKEWEFRLIDCNAEKLYDKDIEWADIILSGGMLPQQHEHLKLIKRVKQFNKVHIIGGPDATSSPHLYKSATHLVLGEAEISMPLFLEDFIAGKAEQTYAAGDKKADMSKTPIPRYDLLNFKNYLHVGVQFARGCPFKCEFCDIIELFGRIPRVKTSEQILKELQVLYELGYRGHVDFVDDNFIGNKNAVKALLPKLKTWLEDHKWPFEFSTEASMNLADDDNLMSLMQEVGFCSVFMGIESPDEETLIQTQKKQNTRRSIPESIHKINRHGMFVNAGYIVGFDSEKDKVASKMLKCIHESAIPVNMVGLMYALPNTQLSRRLKKEGRLRDDYDIPPADAGGQCVSGLNFDTLRPKHEILTDYRDVIKEAYDPKNYFGRVRTFITMMDCSKKRLQLPLSYKIKDIRGLLHFIKAFNLDNTIRTQVWKTIFFCLFNNPKAIRYAIALMALYLHFGPFKNYVVERMDKELSKPRPDFQIPPSAQHPAATYAATP
jgi:radical SAM superfamily enzyme YgiQ (UPF0313 family)